MSKKPFVIECRYVGMNRAPGWLDKVYTSRQKWHVYWRYKTEKERDQAFLTAKHKKKNFGTNRYGSFYRRWEYRINESND